MAELGISKDSFNVVFYCVRKTFKLAQQAEEARSGVRRSARSETTSGSVGKQKPT